MNYSNKKKPNFKKALKIANDILISSYVINSFPFSIIKVIKEKTKIACRSYSHATMFGVDINDFGSKDAIYFDYDGLGIIFYNEKRSLFRRLMSFDSKDFLVHLRKIITLH